MKEMEARLDCQFGKESDREGSWPIATPHKAWIATDID